MRGTVFMADYDKMYAILFQNVTKAISLLQEAQREVEELYISSDDINLRVLSNSDVKANPAKNKKKEK